MLTADQIVPPDVARLLAKCPYMLRITVSLHRGSGVDNASAPALLTIDDSPQGATLDVAYEAQCTVGEGASARRIHDRVSTRAYSPRMAVIWLVERVCMLYCEDLHASQTAMNRVRLPAKKKVFEDEAAAREKGMVALTVLAHEVSAAWPTEPS